MEISQKIILIKLIAVQIIALIGFIFYDWALFEVSVVYLAESAVIYFVFNFDHYFIHPKTRYPIPFALIQMMFSLVFFSGMMFGYAVAVFFITNEAGENAGKLINNLMLPKLQNMNLEYTIFVLLVVETVTYIIRKKKDKRAHLSNSFWRVMTRLLYLHLFIVSGLFVLVVFAQNHYVTVPIFIILKMILDFATEDKRIWNTIRHHLMKNHATQE